jgi:GxxExxY protein
MREFLLRNIPFICQQELQISYKGEVLPLTYKPDLVCYGKIIVELKAVNSLIDEHRAQLHNYLKASGMRLGFLVNFGHVPRVEIERIVV